MKKRSVALFLILALLSGFSLFSLASCSEETLGQLSNIAGEIADILETAPTPDEIRSDLSGAVDSAFGTLGPETEQNPQTESLLQESGTYTTKEDVALYLHTYGKLPSNFITKSEAQSLGWSGGSLEKFAPGKCIGGDVFGNYEKLLPTKSGRVYRECDVDTLGAKERGAKRIVYSNDGLIYYTEDHYESFTLLFGNP